VERQHRVPGDHRRRLAVRLVAVVVVKFVVVVAFGGVFVLGLCSLRSVCACDKIGYGNETGRRK
jgi:hypothetical protein